MIKKKFLKLGFSYFGTKVIIILGVDEICKTTGMAKGAFYNSFKSKENFLIETIHLYGEMKVSYLFKNLNTTNIKAIDRLSTLYKNMFDLQSKKNYSGCLINNMMSEMGTSKQQ